jgi:hypothetical protein
VLLAFADFYFRENTPQGVARATALLPRKTEYLSLRALQVEYEGGDSRALLEKMAALEPLSSTPRIRLGLDAEVRGDPAAAEHWLLAAAAVDAQYEPRWTLANFYFRQQHLPEFWRWLRLALEVSYGDRRPAFDLCWQASGDAAEIWTRAIPERREVVAAYVTYGLAEHHLEAVAPAALKLASWKDPNDFALLDAGMDAFLDSGAGEGAQKIWEGMGYPAPAGIVNPDFEEPRLGHGFDWRLLSPGGVTHVALDTPAAHRIVMNGQQSESCELLRQYVILQAGRRYALRWESRTTGFPVATGLEWKLEGKPGALHASEDWTHGEMTVGEASAPLALLSLTYQRPLGEVRAEGQVELRHVTLTEIPQ